MKRIDGVWFDCLAMANFRVNSPVVLETVDEETIIVNLDSGSYYDLGHVGSHVLADIEAGADVDGVVTRIAGRYGIGEDEAGVAVRALVEELAAEGILIEAAPNGAAPSKPEPATRPWEQPKLGKYTDMQDLLLLDPVHEVDEAGWPRRA